MTPSTNERPPMVSLDPDGMTVPDIYKAMIGMIVPRPIAWISTIGKTGTGNLAPFSFFNGVSSNPPCLAVSIVRKPDGDKKDTLRNIEDTNEFVVNGVSESNIDAVVRSGASHPYGTDERMVEGLTSIASTKVRPPRIAEAAVQIECVLHEIVQIGDGGVGSSSLVIGRIVMIHISQQAWKNGRVDSEALHPVSRLGEQKYAALGEIREISIPKIM